MESSHHLVVVRSAVQRLKHRHLPLYGCGNVQCDEPAVERYRWGLMNLRKLGRPRSPTVCELMAAFGLFLSIVSNAHAQAECNRLKPDIPSDYFAARGCSLLQVVEQFHLGPGRDKIKSQNLSGAAGDFQFILRQFPNHPQSLILLTEVCDRWKSPDRVAFCDLEEWFQRAIEINPKAAGTFVAHGIYLHRLGRFPQAIASFKRSAELDPDSLNAHYNLGLAYLETKQYGLANEHAQRAYALGAPFPGLRNRLERAGQWKPGEAAAPRTSQNAK